MASRVLAASVLAASVLVACGPPPPALPAPPAASAPAASPAPPAALASAPPRTTAAPEPAPILPPAPFSIIARGPADQRFEVFPLESGEAIVALVPAAPTGPVVPRLARLAHDAIRLAPDLVRGLPPLSFGGDHGQFHTDERMAGSLDGGLWLAHGSPCVVREWQPGGWVERAPDRPAPGPCSQLSAWTEGAALAAFDGGSAGLRAYGRAPAVIPQPATSAGRSVCVRAPLVFDYQALRGFRSGEVVAVERSICLHRTVIERWSKGAARSVVTDALVDIDYPFTVALPSPDEALVEGAGLLPGKKSEEGQVSILFRMKKGRLRPTIKENEMNALEGWMTAFPAKIGPNAEPGADGFLHDSFRLTEGSEVFVAASIVRGGRTIEAVLLRNRPVAAAVQMGD